MVCKVVGLAAATLEHTLDTGLRAHNASSSEQAAVATIAVAVVGASAETSPELGDRSHIELGPPENFLVWVGPSAESAGCRSVRRGRTETAPTPDATMMLKVPVSIRAMAVTMVVADWQPHTVTPCVNVRGAAMPACSTAERNTADPAGYPITAADVWKVGLLVAMAVPIRPHLATSMLAAPLGPAPALGRCCTGGGRHTGCGGRGCSGSSDDPGGTRSEAVHTRVAMPHFPPESPARAAITVRVRVDAIVSSGTAPHCRMARRCRTPATGPARAGLATGERRGGAIPGPNGPHGSTIS